MQLFINDQQVDLSDDNPIALTFQINNLAEVRNQQGNTSNQFKLPLTQRNRRILGFPDDVAFCTDAPYQKYQAKVVQNGLEIIPYGVAELNSVDNNTASITILSGNVDFFDAIDGRLYEMGDSKSVWTNYGKNLPWKTYDHKFELDAVINSQNKTDGWIYPVVDYGNLPDHPAPININYLRPGFFIKTAIDMLVKSTGYKAKGSLLNDPLYPLLIAQFSNNTWEHGTDYQNRPDVRGAELQRKAALSLNAHDGFINWDIVVADESKQVSPDMGYFVSNQPNDVKITVTIPKLKLTGRVTPTDQATELNLYIKYRDPNYPTTPDIIVGSQNLSFFGRGEKSNREDSDPKGWTRISGSGSSVYAFIEFTDVVFSIEQQLPINGRVFLTYSYSGLTGSPTPAMATLYENAKMTIASQQGIVRLGQMVQCERIFPDITQKDLLKDTLQRFGIVCQTDNAAKTISFNSFRDIVVNIPVAKNWTAKCLDHGKTISFQLGGYAQVNNLKYKPDDAVLPTGFADSTITVADATLPASTDLLESQFAPTLNRPYIGGTVAQIKMVESESDSDDFSIGVSPRILVDQKLNLAPLKKTVTFTDGNGHTRVVNDIISAPYFYKPDGEHNLCFGDMPGATPGKPLSGIKTKYYAELEKILKHTKKVVRYFLLTPRDILELDILIPIYLEQDGAYYYINKIDAWRKGQAVKVELVKLG